MKRKDLTPGMVVEVRSGQPDGPYTSYARAIVLSLDRWETLAASYLPSGRSRYVPLHESSSRRGGIPVAVERTDYWSGEHVRWEPDVVQASQIVPAGTGDAEAARKAAAREAEVIRQREANERREADRVEIAGRLEALGIDPRTVSIRGSVEMNKDTLRQLLTLAERPNGVAGQDDIDRLNGEDD